MTIQSNVVELIEFLEIISKSSYLERDNGGHQYIWVAHPNALSLGTDDKPKLSIFYKHVEKQG